MDKWKNYNACRNSFVAYSPWWNPRYSSSSIIETCSLSRSREIVYLLFNTLIPSNNPNCTAATFSNTSKPLPTCFCTFLHKYEFHNFVCSLLLKGKSNQTTEMFYTICKVWWFGWEKWRRIEGTQARPTQHTSMSLFFFSSSRLDGLQSSTTF